MRKLIIFTGAICLLVSLSGCVQPLVLYVPPPDRAPSPSAVIRRACDNIVEQLSGYVPTNIEYRLVVRSLDGATGLASAIPLAVTEELKGCLSDSGRFLVVEDTKMDAVLAEAATQEEFKGLIDPDTLVDLEHKLVGVDALIVGSIVDCGSEWDITCRLIPMSMGTVEAHASSRVSKHNFGISSIDYMASVHKPAYLGIIYHGEDGLDISITSVTKLPQDNTVCVEYALYNSGRKKAWVRLVQPEKRTYMIDAAGRTYPLILVGDLAQHEIDILPQTYVTCGLKFHGPSDFVEWMRIITQMDVSGRRFGHNDPIVLYIPGSAL